MLDLLRARNIVAIVCGLLLLAEIAHGQAPPTAAPYLSAPQSAGPIVPLPTTTPPATNFNPDPIPASPEPGSLWTAPVNPSWSVPPKSGWPAAAQPLTAPSPENFSDPGLSISSDRLQPPIVPSAATLAQVMQSYWYTRIDYFHWNERVASMDFVNESGALYTLGYQRRFGQQRFRTELFGGSMFYDGGIQFNDGTSEPMTSRTRYLGALLEAEYLIEPSWLRQGAFFVGVGTRFWVRDIRSGFGALGDFVDETQETWWTLYPYLGLQKAWSLQNGLELFGSARVGATAATYNFSNAFNLPVYPRLGAIGGLELGVRGPRLSVSGTFGIMTWAHSAQELYSTYDAFGNQFISSVFQPNSTLLTVGGKVAYCF